MRAKDVLIVMTRYLATEDFLLMLAKATPETSNHPAERYVKYIDVAESVEYL
jgi:hypothetical protein